MQDKRCSHCKQTLSVTMFYKSICRIDGLSDTCKTCSKEASLKSRRKHIKAVRLRDNRRSNKPHRIIQKRELAKKYRGKYPEKRKAQMEIWRAVKLGNYIKPTKCQLCEEEKRLDAHHEDYTKPLDIIWLCRVCHTNYHLGKDEKYKREITKIIRRASNEF